ncbi:glycosyltransferase family protein [Deltaproteobacteria bacterium TL4]
MKITATIQARMGSTRLPGKVLKLIGGKPMLQRQVERIQRSRLIDEVIIATSTAPQDDAIVDLGKRLKVPVFRGSENDVLGRIASALEAHQVELHVEQVGDSPFSDPQIIDEMIGFYLKHQDQYDFVTNCTKVTYPSGMEVNVYPASVLLDANANVPADEPLREHVEIHISKNPKYRCVCVEAPPFFHNPDIYLEVDTPTDFKMVSAVFEHFDQQGKTHFSLAQILDFLEQRQDLIKLNQNEERRWKVFKDQ